MKLGRVYQAGNKIGVVRTGRPFGIIRPKRCSCGSKRDMVRDMIKEKSEE